MPFPKLVTILSNVSSSGFSEPVWLIYDKRMTTQGQIYCSFCGCISGANVMSFAPQHIFIHQNRCRRLEWLTACHLWAMVSFFGLNSLSLNSRHANGMYKRQDCSATKNYVLKLNMFMFGWVETQLKYIICLIYFQIYFQIDWWQKSPCWTAPTNSHSLSEGDPVHTWMSDFYVKTISK